jgi:hypothetical protein
MVQFPQQGKEWFSDPGKATSSSGCAERQGAAAVPGLHQAFLHEAVWMSNFF